MEADMASPDCVNFSKCYCLQGKLYLKLPALCNKMAKLIASEQMGAVNGKS